MFMLQWNESVNQCPSHQLNRLWAAGDFLPAALHSTRSFITRFVCLHFSAAAAGYSCHSWSTIRQHQFHILCGSHRVISIVKRFPMWRDNNKKKKNTEVAVDIRVLRGWCCAACSLLQGLDECPTHCPLRGASIKLRSACEVRRLKGREAERRPAVITVSCSAGRKRWSWLAEQNGDMK